MNNLEDKCVWKEMADDRESTTFEAMMEGHKLYDCVECSGKPYSCPNYQSGNELRRKYSLDNYGN